MMPLAMLLIWSGSALVEFIRIRSIKSCCGQIITRSGVTVSTKNILTSVCF